MSLEAQIESLNNNLVRLGDILEAALKGGGVGVTTPKEEPAPAPTKKAGKKGKKVEATEPEATEPEAAEPEAAEPEAAEPEAAEPDTVDRKQVVELVKGMLANGNRKTVFDALQKVGAKTLKDCPDNKLAALYAALSA